MAEQTPDVDAGRKPAAREENGGDGKAGDNPRQKSRRRFIIILVVALLIAGALLFYWRSTFYEDTDDAQVNGHLIQVSSRINGNVLSVPVTENQRVKAGDVIVELDPKDYQTTVQQDEANLAAAQSNYESNNVNVPVTAVSANTNVEAIAATLAQVKSSVTQAEQQVEANRQAVAQADANFIKAKLDVERYTPLVQRDVISKQQFDQAVATAKADEAALNQAKANVAASEASLRMTEDTVVQRKAQLTNAKTAPDQIKIQKAKTAQAEAQVEQARAELAQAKLNLSYCRIVAPVDGIITRKSVEVGQNVSTGQNMTTLVSLNDVWITANFKETQLNHMRAGQSVKVTVDAYGGRAYDGVITQIGGATGSVLSLFPPENATGNYVKVVQRVPVRIDLSNRDEDSDHLLRPGLSVEPKVRIKD
ncbi:HlyD family secretion protein [Acidipila sp. EB88]|uniref:HlyD family secretion protein n=1 Tax=Acidipila sp. EB88 TaxID=2305226 RepID=UPI000F5E7127|nr:HlyD family secretion protein [Acidipila sp. EB88]RRA48914.1 HlyD family secretion protein [Acidipila sp. EB88]